MWNRNEVGHMEMGTRSHYAGHVRPYPLSWGAGDGSAPGGNQQRMSRTEKYGSHTMLNHTHTHSHLHTRTYLPAV